MNEQVLQEDLQILKDAIFKSQLQINDFRVLLQDIP